jgi:hypothetical protein
MPKNRLRQLVNRRKTGSTSALPTVTENPQTNLPAISTRPINPLGQSAPRGRGYDKVPPILIKNQSVGDMRQFLGQAEEGPRPSTARTPRNGLSLVLPSSPFDRVILIYRKYSAQIILMQSFFRMLKYRLMMKKYSKLHFTPIVPIHSFDRS